GDQAAAEHRRSRLRREGQVDASLLRGRRQGEDHPALPRPRAGPPGTGHEAAPEGEGRLRTRRQGGVRAPHGGPPDDHDPGAPLVRPITATLFGTAALVAAVFASSVSAQPALAPNAPYAP